MLTCIGCGGYRGGSVSRAACPVCYRYAYGPHPLNVERVARFAKLIAALGIRCRSARAVANTPWDGESLHYYEPTGAPWRLDRLYHEVGHWLVAPEAVRHWTGWGLGSGIDGVTTWGPVVRPHSDEQVAAIVGGVLHRLEDPAQQVPHPYTLPFAGDSAERAQSRLLTIGIDIRAGHNVHVYQRGEW